MPVLVGQGSHCWETWRTMRLGLWEIAASGCGKVRGEGSWEATTRAENARLPTERDSR